MNISSSHRQIDPDRIPSNRRQTKFSAAVPRGEGKITSGSDTCNDDCVSCFTIQAHHQRNSGQYIQCRSFLSILPDSPTLRMQRFFIQTVQYPFNLADSAFSFPSRQDLFNTRVVLCFDPDLLPSISPRSSSLCPSAPWQYCP